MDNNKVSFLIKKLQNNSATPDEKDEYMKYLLDEGKISESQYRDYRKNRNNEDILKIAIIAGAAILLGWAINELTKK